MVTKLKTAVNHRIVPKWYKKWSVQLAGAIGGASLALLVLPDKYSAMIPEGWQGWAVLLIVVAGAIKQNNLDAK